MQQSKEKKDLAELNVSKVDLVLLHAPCHSDKTNAKLWQGLEQALAQNLTRAIGVSNYAKDQLAALLKVGAPVTLQCMICFYVHVSPRASLVMRRRRLEEVAARRGDTPTPTLHSSRWRL